MRIAGRPASDDPQEYFSVFIITLLILLIIKMECRTGLGLIAYPLMCGFRRGDKGTPGHVQLTRFFLLRYVALRGV